MPEALAKVLATWRTTRNAEASAKENFAYYRSAAIIGIQ
jgi:hypothetical protein